MPKQVIIPDTGAISILTTLSLNDIIFHDSTIQLCKIGWLGWTYSCIYRDIMPESFPRFHARILTAGSYKVIIKTGSQILTSNIFTISKTISRLKDFHLKELSYNWNSQTVQDFELLSSVRNLYSDYSVVAPGGSAIRLICFQNEELEHEIKFKAGSNEAILLNIARDKLFLLEVFAHTNILRKWFKRPKLVYRGLINKASAIKSKKYMFQFEIGYDDLPCENDQHDDIPDAAPSWTSKAIIPWRLESFVPNNAHVHSPLFSESNDNFASQDPNFIRLESLLNHNNCNADGHQYNDAPNPDVIFKPHGYYEPQSQPDSSEQFFSDVEVETNEDKVHSMFECPEIFGGFYPDNQNPCSASPAKSTPKVSNLDNLYPMFSDQTSIADQSTQRCGQIKGVLRDYYLEDNAKNNVCAQKFAFSATKSQDRVFCKRENISERAKTKVGRLGLNKQGRDMEDPKLNPLQLVSSDISGNRKNSLHKAESQLLQKSSNIFNFVGEVFSRAAKVASNHFPFGDNKDVK